jgi:Cys-rich protein (TIGR01571 family)
VVCCQLRGVVRTVLSIPGSSWDDCLVSLLCPPCAVLQMVGTLWAAPKEAPGCSFDESPAFVV